MIVKKEQLQFLRRFIKNLDELIRNDDLYELEVAINDAMLEYGIGEDDEMTPLGIEIQKVYDDIYYQNEVS